MIKIQKGINDFETWCKQNNREDLLDEWDYEKNKIRPDEISYGGHKKIAWICSKGHKWDAIISNRRKGLGCPYCSNQKALKGYNDFETWCKQNSCEDLLDEWDYEKNIIRPDEVTKGSKKSVGWKCIRGHKWDTDICSRTNGLGCPYCSNRRVLSGFNDLETWCKQNGREDLLDEWDYEKNGELKPSDIAKSYRKSLVWWKCNKYSHSWAATVESRTSDDKLCGCKVCSGYEILIGFNDLKTWCEQNGRFDIINEWNDNLNISDFTKGSKQVIEWMCANGHSWTDKIVNRTANATNGCPICSGHRVVSGVNDFKTWCEQNNRVDLLNEWDYEKNGDLKPTEIFHHHSKPVAWKCKYGHTWRRRVNARIDRDSHCPECSKENNTSFPEYAICYYLSKNDIYYIHTYRDLGFELDIYIPDKKVGIEYDGGHWHKHKIDADLEKNKKCVENGIKLYRIREGLDVLNDTSVDYVCNQNRHSLNYILSMIFDDIFGLEFDVDVVRDVVDIQNQRILSLKTVSLSDLYPEIAAEWNYEKNGDLVPEMFYGCSGKGVFWKCSKCGFEYFKRIASRTSGGEGCPICARKKVKKVIKGYNDFETWCKQNNREDLLDDWNYEKNEIRPDEITYGSHKYIYWKCSKCGYESLTRLNNRTVGNRGCKACYYDRHKKLGNSVVTTHI